jgi:mannose-6-phosphate isomerase-like protein (cupin superfamily)
MVLAPGDTSGEVGNEHPRSEQWVHVLSGSGHARAGKGRAALRRGTLLVIEKGEEHQLVNTGRAPLVTLNLYVPPAYTRSGEPKASGRK